VYYFRSYLWTRNPSRSSKVSKDSDFSLVSNKNFSEILPSTGLGPGPGEVGQGGLKVLHLWRHSQKIRAPQPQKFFFNGSYKTCRVFWASGQISCAYGATHVQSRCFGANDLKQAGRQRTEKVKGPLLWKKVLRLTK